VHVAARRRHEIGVRKTLGASTPRVLRLMVWDFSKPVLVGNLVAESAVLPSRIEGSRSDTPMRARNFAGDMTDFTPEEVMNRNFGARQGPRSPGIGLAQWTNAARRAGLFQHEFGGRRQGAGILFNMDAQVDYLVAELQANYAGVYRLLTGAGVSLDDASDEVVYNFERPGAILGPHPTIPNRRVVLPRDNPAVQAIFAERRALSAGALRAYNRAHGLP
jgi:hypothetical protein